MKTNKIMAWVEWLIFIILVLAFAYVSKSTGLFYNAVIIYGLFQLIQIKHNTDK